MTLNTSAVGSVLWINLSTWIGFTYIGTGKEIADMMTKSRIALALRSGKVVERSTVAKREMVKLSSLVKLSS